MGREKRKREWRKERETEEKKEREYVRTYVHPLGAVRGTFKLP